MKRCTATLWSTTTLGSSSSRCFASTSRYTLDHPLPPLAPPSFESLYPPTTTTRSKRTPPPSPPLPLSPTPHSDPTQTSPYLPQNTREKNHLLLQLRRALDSTDPDTTWAALATVLRYPDQLPFLPRSHFPTSTRSPPSSTTIEGTGPFDPSFSTTRTIGGRNKIELSEKELKQCFRVFANQRPRTRNGLNRLLIIIELLARRSPSTSQPDHEGEGEREEEEGEGVERLKGGGVGLGDREWRELILFVGSSRRRTRPDPDTKSVLSLFGQREEGINRKQEEGKKGKGKGKEGRAIMGREETRMYNALLHVAEKSKMWELFDQVQGRMWEKGIRIDGATFVSRIKRESSRGSDLQVIWRIFEEGLRWSMMENEEVGKRARRDSRRVLVNVWVWVLAKRGMVDECEKIYRAMKEGKTVDLDQFKPSTSNYSNYSYSPNSPFITSTPPTSSNSPSLQVRLPSPDFRLYSALIQSYSHHGQLKLALLKLFEMVHSSSLPATPQHFHSLFKSYVQYAPPSSSDSLLVDYASLTGINQHKPRSLDYSPLSTLLSRSSQSPLKPSSSSSSEYTLSTLLTLYNSFLTLSPPTKHSPSLPFSGTRSSPSPKTIYFLLKAFERVLGKGNEEVCFEVFERVERKFAGGRKGWMGWRMDKRVEGLVRGYKEGVEENRRRREEVGLI